MNIFSFSKYTETFFTFNINFYNTNTLQQFSLVFEQNWRGQNSRGEKVALCVWKNLGDCKKQAQRSSFFQIYFPMNRTSSSRRLAAPHFSPFFLFKDSNLSFSLWKLLLCDECNQIRMLYFEKTLTLAHKSILDHDITLIIAHDWY